MSLLSSAPLPRRDSSSTDQAATARASGPTGAPPVEDWSGALRRGLQAATGATVAYAGEPVALGHSEGPWAFRFGLTQPMRWDAAAAVTPDAEPDDVGTAALAVRLAPDHASVEREAAAMRVARRHLGGAARVRAVMRLGDDPEPLWALVRDEVGGVPLPELIGFNLHRSDELLHGFAAHQAAIHRIPAAGLGDDHGLTVVDAEAEVARIDASRFPKERRWLDAHLPAPDDPVLCHGGYQPMSVFGPPAEDWETHGGAGRGLVTTNWCGAVLAEPAFDVAYTLVALWSAPFFAKNRAERTAIKMIRNTLINTYKQGYEEVRSLEGDRVRFWEAFHVLRGMARLDGSYDGTDSAFAPPDRGTLPTELAAELPRRYQQLTRVR